MLAAAVCSWQNCLLVSRSTTQERCHLKLTHADVDERIGRTYRNRQLLKQAGLHSLIQGGVDSVRRADDKRVAVAVVSGTRSRGNDSYLFVPLPSRSSALTGGDKSKDMGGLLLEDGRDFLLYNGNVFGLKFNLAWLSISGGCSVK